MYSLEQIVTAAHLEHERDRQKGLGLLIVLGGGISIWTAIFTLVLYIL